MKAADYCLVVVIETVIFRIIQVVADFADARQSRPNRMVSERFNLP